MLVFATKSADIRISITTVRKISALGNHLGLDLLTVYVFFMDNP